MADDFDINSLATYLHLTPAQIKKMAERGKLPGRRVAGEWVFPNADIHTWFEDRIGASDERELAEVEKVLDTATDDSEPDVTIGGLLRTDHVFVPLAARTKNSVIKTICDNCAATGELWDPKRMSNAIFERESLHPTALDNGVALLHPRRPQSGIISDTFLALGITTTGIPFGGPRGTMTDIFFMIASADEAIHLRILARISRLIHVPELLDKLRDAGDAAEAMNIISDAEAEIN